MKIIRGYIREYSAKVVYVTEELVPEFEIKDLHLVSVKIQKKNIEYLDDLVREGRYSNRSEIIRLALRDLIKEIEGKY